MKRKRILSLVLCAALCLSLAACGRGAEGGEASAQPSASPSAKTPEELADAYTQAIEAARDDEMNEYFPVVTNTTQTDATDQEMTFTVLGFAPEDVSAYGVSLSLMNVNAYAIVAAMPAEGKEETVKTGLENYIESQKSSFEFYLEDQFDIAAQAKLETLDDGTLLLVMCEGQDTVFDAIKTELEK